MKDIETGKELHDELFTMEKTWYKPLPEHLNMIGEGNKLLACVDTEIHTVVLRNTNSFDKATIQLTVFVNETDITTITAKFKDIDCWGLCTINYAKEVRL